MSSYRDWITALRDLGLGRHSRVLVHASIEAMNPIAGGVGTVVGALLATCETVVAPTFTQRTLLIPRVGPPDNGLTYESSNDEVDLSSRYAGRCRNGGAGGSAAPPRRGAA